MKKLLNILPVFIIAVSMLCPGISPLFSANAVLAENRQEEKAGDKDRAGDDEEGGDTSAGEPDKTKPEVFGFEAGYNSSYAEGAAPYSFYSQPFVNFYLKHKYVKFTGGLSRFWNYQITNGEGKYENLNFTQPKLALSLYPHRVIEIYGEYRYWAGDKSHYYKTHDGTAGFHLDFEVVNLGFSGNYKKTEYKFKSDDAEAFYNIYSNNKPYFPLNPALGLYVSYRSFKKRNMQHTSDLTLDPTFSVYVHETTSLDLSYEYQKSFFEYYITGNRTKNDAYYLHTGKLGITSDPVDFLSFFADVSIGKDSQDYIIAGGDLGLTFSILDYVTLSGTYTPAYYMPPPVTIWGREASQSFLEFQELWALYNLVRWRNINPYMRLSNIGKAFWSHGVSISASYKY